MKSKAIILILNAIYLFATITWAILDQSFEAVVAIIGGIVSLATFFVANDNSFSVRKNIVKGGENSISVVGNVKHIEHKTIVNVIRPTFDFRDRSFIDEDSEKK